ncbi:metallophosphoesterase family protein [Candidatus Arthromitus sp. SFB-rat-Yit]|uniref:metallophosphoesterase family protein n=1 Tax=Candidatus Arthromitus sp. SFB-rat-Yit TaxID=1041504 RepID=UPI000227A174|nr:metallophosphoesterase family protein [Candidatus Arthromitus sp. SFB-rat-Yit]BAK81298.1 phosphoesterase, putative [Candidatus Arthromitus sp. SFB-rat-Yit]
MLKNIGVISDTHGLIRTEVYEFFKDCDLIIHAGDIVKESTIYELESICKVEAISGNNDFMLNQNIYPDYKKLNLNGSLSIYVIHDLTYMNEEYTNYDIVIHGHTHKPSEEYINDTLILNPGSFGPRRFSLPISLAVVNIESKPQVKFFNI